MKTESRSVRPAWFRALPFLLLATRLSAQTSAPSDSLLDHLIGHWVLQGPMAGQPSVTHDVSFEWVLNKEYVVMHEVSREKTASGTPAYEAIVYIYADQKTRQFAALWLDNTAASPFDPIGVGHATASGDSIPFLWNYSATDKFHNTFIYHRKSDTWRWVMDNEQNGVLRNFARVTLKRDK
jgi:hypothetical protein